MNLSRDRPVSDDECNRMLMTVHSAVEFPRMFSTTIFTNLDECRTECEIADDNSVVAVVYEERDGWRVNRLRSISEGEG